MQKISEWLLLKIVQPARTLSSSEVGLEGAVGLYGGIFPIPMISTGATWALCYGPFRSKFNPAMISITVATSAIATPLQLLCMPLFMNIPYHIVSQPVSKSLINSLSPEWNTIIESKTPECNVSDFLESVKALPLQETFAKFGSCMAYSAVSWLPLAPIAIVLTRFLIATSVKRFISTKQTWRLGR